MIELVTPDDPWAFRMLEKYLPPKDIHWSFDKVTALKQVVAAWHARQEFWLADKAHDFMFRCVVHNPDVVLPHIMGDGRYIRSCGRQAMDFVKAQGVKQVLVWTQHESIGRIMQGMGFTEVARIPNMYYDDGVTQEVTAWCKELIQ